MKELFNIISLVAAILVVTTILLQQQGSSLGAGFGGETNFYRSKRGVERILYNTTIVSAVVLVADNFFLSLGQAQGRNIDAQLVHYA